MAIRPHPNFDEIKQAIQKLSKQALRGGRNIVIFPQKLKAPETLSGFSLKPIP
jgi:hypothetical protein